MILLQSCLAEGSREEFCDSSVSASAAIGVLEAGDEVRETATLSVICQLIAAEANAIAPESQCYNVASRGYKSHLASRQLTLR